jgi:2-polyprenyl-3-methyl-5-hydroxy-6-metoxy-1,4-benzoquinol methylase
MADKDLYLNIDINVEMAKGHLKYLKPYLDAINRRMDNPNYPILEIGIGTGLCSIYLGQLGYTNVFGVDIEPEIVERFNKETKHLFESEASVFVGDAFDLTALKNNLGGVVCIHHQGLLEHFKVSDIIRMLDHQVQITDGYVIFAVPLEGHKDKSEYDPDEIRWSLEKWLALINSKYLLFEYGVFGVDADKHQAYFVINKYWREK